jgi:uncharacterized membrane protein YfcA
MVLRWVFLLICGWLAATISGASGFGGALLLLPVLAYAVGGKAAVPILTLAQLLGNLSRAGFGRREIRWRPALAFGAGAVPASIVGSRLFVALPPASVLRVIGVFLLGVVALRHTAVGRRPFPGPLLAPAGLVVELLSAIAGSAGPLGAAVFLGLRLPAGAYVATEAVTAVLMHPTKSVVYGRYAALTRPDLIRGLALVGAMMIGSWTGRKVVERLPGRGFDVLVEILLLGAAVPLILVRD